MEGHMGWAGAIKWLLALWLGGAQAAEGGFDPLAAAEALAQPPPSEDERAAEARLAALQERRRPRGARVVVLPWPGASTGHRHALLQALVRNTVGRADARFVPALDLHQGGRVRRDADGRPRDPAAQLGQVPERVLEEVRAEVRQANARLGPDGFGDAELAGRLSGLVPRIWFNDRPATREVLFDLYVAIGRAAAGIPEQTPPLYQMVGRHHNNFHLYLAAAMLWEEREAGGADLAARKPRGRAGRWLDDLVHRIDDGTHPPLPLAFHEAGRFEAERFARTYRVTVNGLERVVDDSGVVRVPRGRIDVALQRGARSHGLSEHLEVVRLDDKAYFVLETARQETGWELLSQLLAHPSECSPALRAEAAAALATYAALHPDDEVYVAVPRGGSARHVLVWRWDGLGSGLNLLVDRNRGFPVRFALLGNLGTAFSGGSLDPDSAAALLTSAPAEAALSDVAKLTPSAFTADVQLRAHFNRLMVAVGASFGKSIRPDAEGLWRERYPVDGHLVVEAPGGAVEQLRERAWNRLLYGAVGLFLLEDAPFGLGPRGFLRAGWYNLPHAVDLSGHLGFTYDPSFGRQDHPGRLVPLIDLDVYAGVLVPFGDTLFCRAPGRGTCRDPTLLPNLGLSLGAGLSF